MSTCPHVHMSTRIQKIFFPEIFFCGYENFRVHAQGIRIVWYPIKSRWAGAWTPILSLCHGIFTDWSTFSTPFLLWKKGHSSPVTQWRQLVSCDWLWHSHGSLIQSRFDLKTRPCARVNLCPGGFCCCIKLDGLSNLKYCWNLLGK